MEELGVRMAVFGRVEEPGRTLRLWAVERKGDGAPDSGDQRPVELTSGTPLEGLHEDLRAEIAVAALTAAVQIMSIEPWGEGMERDLEGFIARMRSLLDGDSMTDPGRRPFCTTRLAPRFPPLADEGRQRAPRRGGRRLLRGARGLARERAPIEWAHTKGNLGLALLALGTCKDDARLLGKAVDAFRAALKEITRERAPHDWALATSELGSTLSRLGSRKDDTGLVGEAVAAYRAVIEEFPPPARPRGWAETQEHLGAALMFLSLLKKNAGILEQAADAWRAALEEHERMPPDRAAATRERLEDVLDGLDALKGGGAPPSG